MNKIKTSDPVFTRALSAIGLFNNTMDEHGFWSLDDSRGICVSRVAPRELQGLIDAAAAVVGAVHGIRSLGASFIILNLPDFGQENESFAPEHRWGECNGVMARSLVIGRDQGWGVRVSISIPRDQLDPHRLAPYWCNIRFNVEIPDRALFVTTPYPLLATDGSWRGGR